MLSRLTRNKVLEAKTRPAPTLFEPKKPEPEPQRRILEAIQQEPVTPIAKSVRTRKIELDEAPRAALPKSVKLNKALDSVQPPPFAKDVENDHPVVARPRLVRPPKAAHVETPVAALPEPVELDAAPSIKIDQPQLMVDAAVVDAAENNQPAVAKPQRGRPRKIATVETLPRQQPTGKTHASAKLKFFDQINDSEQKPQIDNIPAIQLKKPENWPIGKRWKRNVAWDQHSWR